MITFTQSERAETEEQAVRHLGVSPLSARIVAAMAAIPWGEFDFSVPRVSSQAKVAASFGVATRTVEKWITRGMPRGDSDYSIPKIRDWLERKNSERKPQSPSYYAASTALRGALRLMATVPIEIMAALVEATGTRIEGTSKESHENSLYVAKLTLIRRLDKFRLTDDQVEQIAAEVTGVICDARHD